MEKLTNIEAITVEALTVFSELNRLDEPRLLDPIQHATDTLHRLTEFIDVVLPFAESDLNISDIMFLKEHFDKMSPQGTFMKERIERIQYILHCLFTFHIAVQKHQRFLYNLSTALGQIHETIETI